MILYVKLSSPDVVSSMGLEVCLLFQMQKKKSQLLFNLPGLLEYFHFRELGPSEPSQMLFPIFPIYESSLPLQGVDSQAKICISNDDNSNNLNMAGSLLRT